jgi:PhnB protein
LFWKVCNTTGKDAVSIAPMLSVRNGKGAIEFYIEALGAQVLFRLDGEQDDVVAELSVGGARFWIC